MSGADFIVQVILTQALSISHLNSLHFPTSYNPQLNYQLMHLLDFLPAASWLAQLDDGFLNTFTDLHGLLTSGNALKAKVDFDLTSGESTPDGVPVSIGSIIKRLVPMSVKRKISMKAIQRFSRNIGHSLEYSLVWQE